MTGSRLARQKAEEEANAFILGKNETPTQDSENNAESNTGDEGNNVQHETQDRTPAPVQATDSADELREKLRISEARNEVLQGKYLAEVPRLNSEIKSLTDQLNAKEQSPNVDALNKRIQDLELQLNSKESDAVSSDAEVADYISSEYDPQLAKSILAMIKQHATPQNGEEVGQLRQQVEDIQRTNQQANHELKVTSLRNKLSASGINFDKTDGDPLFHDWLAQEHPGTGANRQYFLNKHFSSGDIDAAAKFYSDFKAQERSSYDKNPLSNHVDVSGQHNSGDSLEQPDHWSAADIDKLYSDLRRGKITQAEFAKHEQSLNRALQAGLVTQ